MRTRKKVHENGVFFFMNYLSFELAFGFQFVCSGFLALTFPNRTSQLCRALPCCCSCRKGASLLHNKRSYLILNIIYSVVLTVIPTAPTSF